MRQVPTIKELQQIQIQNNQQDVYSILNKGGFKMCRESVTELHCNAIWHIKPKKHATTYPIAIAVISGLFLGVVAVYSIGNFDDTPLGLLYPRDWTHVFLVIFPKMD